MLSQCRHIPNTWTSVNEYAHGTRGSCHIGGGVITDLAGKQVWSYGRGGGDGHQQEHHDLFASLRKGDVPNEGDYGALSSMTAILGRMATYSGKMISWDEAINSQLIIAPVDSFVSFDDTPPVVPDDEGRYPIPMPGKTRVL